MWKEKKIVFAFPSPTSSLHRSIPLSKQWWKKKARNNATRPSSWWSFSNSVVLWTERQFQFTQHLEEILPGQPCFRQQVAYVGGEATLRVFLTPTLGPQISVLQGEWNTVTDVFGNLRKLSHLAPLPSHLITNHMSMDLHFGWRKYSTDLV